MKNCNKELVSSIRRDISKYICKNRLVKVTIFKQWDKYHGTLIFSKKTKVYGYSRLNDSDKFMDKSLGTLYAIFRYINSKPKIDEDERKLIDRVHLIIPKGYKRFLKYPLFLDKYAENIIHHSDNLTPGYNKVNFQVDIVRYDAMYINGLEAQLSSQNLTRKYYEV